MPTRFGALLVQSKIGPPKAMCYQTQRYRMYEGDRLVFETSQVRRAGSAGRSDI